jgi:hypothetical protein
MWARSGKHYIENNIRYGWSNFPVSTLHICSHSRAGWKAPKAELRAASGLALFLVPLS